MLFFHFSYAFALCVLLQWFGMVCVPAGRLISAIPDGKLPRTASAWKAAGNNINHFLSIHRRPGG